MSLATQGNVHMTTDNAQLLLDTWAMNGETEPQPLSFFRGFDCFARKTSICCTSFDGLTLSLSDKRTMVLSVGLLTPRSSRLMNVRSKLHWNANSS